MSDTIEIRQCDALMINEKVKALVYLVMSIL